MGPISMYRRDGAVPVVFELKNHALKQSFVLNGPNLVGGMAIDVPSTRIWVRRRTGQQWFPTLRQGLGGQFRCSPWLTADVSRETPRLGRQDLARPSRLSVTAHFPAHTPRQSCRPHNGDFTQRDLGIVPTQEAFKGSVVGPFLLGAKDSPFPKHKRCVSDAHSGLTSCVSLLRVFPNGWSEFRSCCCRTDAGSLAND